MVHTQELTKGNLYGHLAKLAVPLIFGNILQQFYNTIDAYVVGRYVGQKEFAAIGIAGTVMNLFLFAMVGACTGISVLFAKCYGRKDYEALRAQHFTALYAGLSGSVLLGIAGILGMQGILGLIQTPEELKGYISEYLIWIFLSMPMAYLYNMYASALRAAGDTSAALWILAASVAANLGLDILFVVKVKMGIGGAAKATAITQCISAVLCMGYMAVAHKELLLTKKSCRFKKRLFGDTVRYGIVTALHQTGVYLGKMLVWGAVNTAGTEGIAAYTAATRVEGFVNSFADSGSASTSVLAAQNYGAGDRERVKKTFRCSLTELLTLGIVGGILIFTASPWAAGLMLGATDGYAHMEAVRYLKTIAVVYPLCFTCSVFTGFYNGIGKVALTLIGTLGQIALRVIFSWILFGRFQLAAVAAATGIGWLAANVFWTWRLRKITLG